MELRLPPRHQRGCPRNILRVLALWYAKPGITQEEFDQKVKQLESVIDCTCKK